MATVDRISRYKVVLDDIRRRVRERFENGASAVQTAALQSELFDRFVVQVLTEHLQDLDPISRLSVESQSALLAVGGSGRAEMCPYSDVDLLFLSAPSISTRYEPLTSQVQRDLWDCGLKVGASVRTLADSIQWARQEPQFATSLVDARHLWGSTSLVDQLQSRFRRSVVRARHQQFISDAVAARDKERTDYGATTQQLEPDLKRSLGGLRDLHLIRWIGFARYGVADIDSLRLHSAITMEEARRLVHAHEFLTGLRIDLHLAAGKEQDVLTREDQLRIAKKRNIQAVGAQSPVERFMQQYFQHSTTVAEIARRFVTRSRRSPWVERFIRFVMSYRVDEIYYVGPEFVDIGHRHRSAALSSLEGILRLFMTAARYNVCVAPHLLELIKSQSLKPPAQLSTEASQAFLALLKTSGKLGVTLRGLYETGVLEAVLPCWQHIRCLLQFNQYHHFTVDEHTLRTIEAAEGFLKSGGPLGQAYREIHHKELLHLTLLLHDAGKGFEEDHSELGRRLAEETSNRLGLPDHQRDLVMFLVHRHLKMADLALRRDIGDRALLLKFSHEVGSPDALRMLYVLTAADISAVGPNTWNEWKAELLTTLYERTMLWLSGKSHLFDESTRLRQIQQQVVQLCRGTTESTGELPDGQAAIETEAWQKRVEQCPAHYLLETTPSRIAADMRVIRARQPDEIHVEAQYDAETGTVEYRVITDETIAAGCFHKLAGVLSAKRMEILNATICTTQDRLIIDALRVRDADHAGEIPEFRTEEVASAIRKVLRDETDVATLLKSRGRFAVQAIQGPVSDLPLRVVVDNETSDRYTVIDVFAHDRPGLLYEITRALYVLQLSVVLAKIATHFDQVLDVFFVTDAAGNKIHDGERLKSIRQHLMTELTAFEKSVTDDQTV
ncbi:MAG: [protein-PII] uridylyltransferase [Planctomycetes bacterium]|nr:[protein-PII] uridylyltransferase [Planctomycetota bacterium]